MQISDLVEEYFPNASDEFIEFVLWERTGWPCFWNIPEDGNTPEECLRNQLERARNDLEP